MGCKETRSNQTLVQVDFDAKDSKGRVIGSMIQAWESDWIEQPSGGWIVEPGHYFCFMGHATRNGEPYGASQRDHRFATAQERSDAAEAYLANARRRAERKVAR